MFARDSDPIVVNNTFFFNVASSPDPSQAEGTGGAIHLQEGGDFLGGICNCDYPDCLPIRNRIDNGLTAQLVKGEFVCFIDFEKCNGCGDCLGRCNFNALKYETTTEKANIDQFACFGCGLCETACPRDAIYYRERKKLPGLANVW